MDTHFLVIDIFLFFLAIIGIIVGCWAMVLVQALMRSTHKVQMIDPFEDIRRAVMEPDDVPPPISEKTKEKINKMPEEYDLVN